MPAKPVILKIARFNYEKFAQVFNLLGNKHRLKVVLALKQHGELTVTAIVKILHQSQPAVSHHLALLRIGGILVTRRSGKNIYYRLESMLVSDLADQLNGV